MVYAHFLWKKRNHFRVEMTLCFVSHHTILSQTFLANAARKMNRVQFWYLLPHKYSSKTFQVQYQSTKCKYFQKWSCNPYLFCLAVFKFTLHTIFYPFFSKSTSICEDYMNILIIIKMNYHYILSYQLCQPNNMLFNQHKQLKFVGVSTKAFK